MIPAKPEETTIETAGWEWMLVEVMGFRKHWGRTREEERIGGKFLRVDIPVKGDPSVYGWETHFYGAPAIFSITLSDEATVMKENTPWDAPARLRYEPMEVIEPEPSLRIPPIVILDDDDTPDPNDMPF